MIWIPFRGYFIFIIGLSAAGNAHLYWTKDISDYHFIPTQYLTTHAVTLACPGDVEEGDLGLVECKRQAVETVQQETETCR